MSDESLLIMVETFNKHYENSKGKISDNDMAFIMKLFTEKQKRKI
jgi:hypothetical protein